MPCPRSPPIARRNNSILAGRRSGERKPGEATLEAASRQDGRKCGKCSGLHLERHDKELGGSALRFLTAAIVAGGRCDVRVTGDGRHRRDIGARVEQIRYERPAKVVRAEACDARLSKTGPVG